MSTGQDLPPAQWNRISIGGAYNEHSLAPFG
jgi:hypothetical protein